VAVKTTTTMVEKDSGGGSNNKGGKRQVKKNKMLMRETTTSNSSVTTSTSSPYPAVTVALTLLYSCQRGSEEKREKAIWPIGGEEMRWKKTTAVFTTVKTAVKKDMLWFVVGGGQCFGQCFLLWRMCDKRHDNYLTWVTCGRENWMISNIQTVSHKYSKIV
jgi:hypothetical protein